MRRPRHIVRSKINAFRHQGFVVKVTLAPSALINISDHVKNYLSLSGSDASAFLAVAHKLSELHALSLSDAYRLQAVRALEAHLQFNLPLDPDSVQDNAELSRLPAMGGSRCI